MSQRSTLDRALAVVGITLALLLIGCGESAGPFDASATDPTNADAGSRVSALAVSPGNHTAAVGDVIQYTTTATLLSGVTRSGVAATWRSTNAAVATVNASGRVVARASGTTTITASTGGRTATVPLMVTGTTSGTTGTPTAPVPAPTTAPAIGAGEPVFTGGAQTSLWADDFEGTLTDAAIFARYTTQNGENGLHVDATGGLGGSRALRIDWRAKSGCTDDSHLLEGSFPSAVQEVVVQYSVRYQPGFVFDWIGRSGGCTGNAKKLFFLWAAQGSRFDFISENHTLGVGSDVDHPLFSQNVGGALRPDDLADGGWHRITLRIRQSSTPTATDGSIHGWIDGVQKWAVTNVASNASGGWVLFKLPTTFNQGSPADQSEWLDGFRIWTP